MPSVPLPPHQGSSNFMGQLKELFDAWASPGALQYVADSAPGAIQQWQCRCGPLQGGWLLLL